jgi:hypothetical protein
LEPSFFSDILCPYKREYFLSVPFVYTLYKMEQNRHPKTFTFVNLNADSNVFSRISSNQRVFTFVDENNPLREFEEHTAIQRERNREAVELNERKV